ncbi:RNA polymerase II mediator complex subunit Sin4 [Lasiosphaeria miniovina]|uniref:Mediator of RNA polymerase II transcription subunit 16 n=1 Tax=Lasiosphaeria miniovina TaxID=1954250 RepID=A0AA40DL21_9PEZI|nr:RNA polymerase II mediator complex subunit Sin4 [Lasiosphaeria miniovina]KAK0703773.1 RNA polymerase II mediator complex subunit Sin4 [Lasiosphaeria miniovina]
MSAHQDMPLLLGGSLDVVGVGVGVSVDVDTDMHGMDGAMAALHDVDLFGDPVMDNSLALPMPPVPARPSPSKQLQQRLDELRARGCCQGIAWSRQGTIAAIAKDGHTLDLRFLRCRPDSGDWELTDPNPWYTPPLAQQGGPITHLAWAATGIPELAVIDAVGRVTLMSFSIALNRPYSLRRFDVDPVDDLNAVVGCYWLPLTSHHTKQFLVVHGSAVWNQSAYKYETLFSPPFGPLHPNPNKSAFLVVTASGVLKLFFSQNSARIEEASLELESVTSSDDLITHASICTDIKNQLLISLATASKQLRVIRASIQWGLPQPSDRQAPPGSIHLNPAIKESHVAVTSWLQYGPSESSLDMSMAQLSHIQTLPPLVESINPPLLTPPVVLTVRSYLPRDTSYNQESQSIIDRWEVLSDQPQTLHPAFAQLGSKNAAASPPSTSRLRKLDPVVIPKIIVSIHLMQLGRVICFVFSDGTVQYRDRATMNEIYNEHNIACINSPVQVGFQFTNDTPCLQAVFSPTNCSFAQVCEDGSIKWNRLHYPMDDPVTALQDSRQYNAVLGALTLAISSSAAHQTNCDDILAIVRPFTRKPDFTSAWIREMVNMLKFSVDYSEDAHHDQLVRNYNLQLCLSILNHLGFHGEFQPRSFSGKFAMLALNVRNIVILITIASNTPANLKEKLIPLDEPEVVDALAGCAKWAVDLLSWITDCIFGLLGDPVFMGILADPKRFSELAPYLQSQDDVSLHLLLCSSTRGFLSAACRRLVHLDSLCIRAAHFYQKQKDGDSTNPTARPSEPLYHAYQKMARSTNSNLVKVQKFDALIGGLSQEIKAAYQRTLSGLTSKPKQRDQGNSQQGQNNNANEQLVKKAQTHCELDMLLAANPPPGFRDVLFKFFNSSLPAFRSQTDPARLYFGNYDILEVDDNRKILASKKAAGRYIDVFKRVELFSGPKAAKNSSLSHGGAADDTGPQWRRCVRCASVMEDVWGTRPGFTFVLGQQRKCSCGGNWGLLPRSSVRS